MTASMVGRVNGFDPQVANAALDERMTNLSGRFNSLETNVTRQLTGLEAQIEGLAGKFAESRRPQWQAISVALGVIALVGGFAYWPINAGISDVKFAVMKLADESISPDERKYRTERQAEDRERQALELRDLKVALENVRAASVPMSQWQEQVRGRDTQIDDLTKRFDTSIAETNTRVSENRASIGAVYSARDVIMDLHNQVEDLRKRVEGQTKWP